VADAHTDPPRSGRVPTGRVRGEERLQMRSFWVIVSWRLVPACEPGEACPRPPAKGLDRRALGPTARVVAASVLVGGGAGVIMSNRVAWRQGAVRSVRLGIQSHLTYFLLAPPRRPAADPPPERGGRRGPSVPGARSSPPRTGLRPPLGTDGPRCQVVSPRCFSYAARPGPHRVRPADPLKPERDLGVIQVRVIAALAADELKRVGVAAFHPALHDAAGWRRRLAVRPWPG